MQRASTKRLRLGRGTCGRRGSGSGGGRRGRGCGSGVAAVGEGDLDPAGAVVEAVLAPSAGLVSTKGIRLRCPRRGGGGSGSEPRAARVRRGRREGGDGCKDAGGFIGPQPVFKIPQLPLTELDVRRFSFSRGGQKREFGVAALLGALVKFLSGDPKFWVLYLIEFRVLAYFHIKSLFFINFAFTSGYISSNFFVVYL